METILTCLEDLRRYENDKPFRFVGFTNLPEGWESNRKYIDQEDISVTEVRKKEVSFSSTKAGFALRQH